MARSSASSICRNSSGEKKLPSRFHASLPGANAHHGELENSDGFILSAKRIAPDWILCKTGFALERGCVVLDQPQQVTNFIRFRVGAACCGWFRCAEHSRAPFSDTLSKRAGHPGKIGRLVERKLKRCERRAPPR